MHWADLAQGSRSGFLTGELVVVTQKESFYFFTEVKILSVALSIARNCKVCRKWPIMDLNLSSFLDGPDVLFVALRIGAHWPYSLSTTPSQLKICEQDDTLLIIHVYAILQSSPFGFRPFSWNYAFLLKKTFLQLYAYLLVVNIFSGRLFHKSELLRGFFLGEDRPFFRWFPEGWYAFCARWKTFFFGGGGDFSIFLY